MMRVPAFYARLIKSCQRRGRTIEESEDLVQEAYLRLLEYRATAIVRDEKTFLARIVTNLTINHFRREQILPFASEPFEELEKLATFADRSPTPERIIAARERLEEIMDLLTSASRRTCRIFMDRRLGYTHEEIASRMGVSRRTVQKHLARAKSLLKLLLAER